MNISSTERDLNDLDAANAWDVFYERLQNISSIQTQFLTIDNGQAVENRWKNRYRDVIPFDSTRILLESDSTEDYINANFVQIESVNNRRYILAQGPLQQTCDHFWQMVWEQKCPAIVMLNKVYERGSLKCHKYFPECEETFEFESVGLQVTCTSQEEHKFYVTRTMSIFSKYTKKSHQLVHFHYTHWPDFGVPNSPGCMLNFLWGIRREGVLDNPETPCVVHCSAGIGRSGTFVLIDLALLLIEQFGSINEISLTDILLSLRHCRMGIVQTPHQLRYSYRAVVEGGKLLVATPSSLRSALQFPEDDPLLQRLDSSDDDDDDADDDSDDESFVADDDELMRHLHLRASAGASPSNELFFTGSVTGSLSGDEDDEMLRLLAASGLASGDQWQQAAQQCTQANNKTSDGPVTEPVLDDDTQQVNDSEPGTSNKRSAMESADSSTNQGQLEQPVFSVDSNGDTLDTQPEGQESSGSSGDENDGADGNDDNEEEEEDSGDLDEDDEEEERVAQLVAALEAARARREARSARQQMTRAKLDEISARMREREMMRHRWLPASIALPLTRWFTGSGLINTPAQAILTSVGMFSLLVAVAVGWFYRRG